MLIERLRCEHRTNPLGLDDVAPRLTWECSSDRERASVAASRVVVTGDDGGALWDSGWVAGAGAGQTYAGPALPPSTRAWWTVSVEDDRGERFDAGERAWWETSIGPDGWSPDAAWLAAPRFTVPHLRHEFELAAPPARARLTITALGIYRAVLNGRRVGDDFFRPGWTDYRRRLQVQTYDVTDLLEAGANAFGIVLANGWYAGRIGWLGERGHYGATPSVRAQLDVVHDDGTTSLVTTSDEWRARAGGIVDTDMLLGERFDRRQELTGWDQPGFAPPHKPAFPVRVIDPPAGVALLSSAAEPVRVTEVLEVREVTEPEPGTWILDFGQNLVGWARIRVSGERGDTVRLRFAEVLRPDGLLYTDNLRTAQAGDEYTCGGGQDEEWEPVFTFHGFRYVEVRGWPGGGPPPPGAVVAVVAHSELDRTGVVETSSPLVDQLLSNIDWGLRGNFLEVPTDCPQRDERLGWMGDIQVFAATACFQRDVQAFFKKWMWDVVDGQTERGAFPDVAPKVVDGQDGMPAWGDAGVIVPWRAYEWYGDEELVRTHYRAAARWVDYISDENPDGRWLKRRNGDVGDWLSVGATTPKEVLATAFYAHSADLAARMAAVAGDEEEAGRLRSVFDFVRAAFNQHYVSASDGRIEGDTQTAYALALRFGLLPEELRAFAGDHLAADVTARDFHPTVGFVGVPHLLPALSDTGHADVAYRVLLQRTFPSWGHQIDCGATTMWEHWDGWTPEKGFQNPEMNSFNHYAFGAVGEWIATRVAGIGPDPEAPGFHNVLLRPTPGEGLSWAKGRFRSVRGWIECGWSRSSDNGSVRVDVSLPPLCTGSLWLPGATEATALPSGRHTFTVGA